MPSNQSGSRKRTKTGDATGTTTITKKTSPYDRAFEQHLIDHRIYPSRYRHTDGKNVQEPDNVEELRTMLARPRASLSPSRFTDRKWEDFELVNEQAMTEDSVMSKAFPIIAGTADVPYQENLLFGNLKELTDGSITQAQPDVYYGEFS